MAEGQLLFDWDYTEFNEVWSQKNLSKLQQKFDTSPVNLSQSLLLSEEIKGSYWLLADFKNEKTYNIRKENETTVEISEGSDLGKRSDILKDAGTIVPRLKSGIGTHTGIIYALKRLNFNIDNLENLKRSGLSDKKLSFEDVYPDLEVAYEMLNEILASPRDALVSLSSRDVKHLQNHVLQSYEMNRKILDFGTGTENENIREQHSALLQEIHQFSEGVKYSLLQVAAYLSSRTVEQLKDEFKSAFADAEERVNTAISSGTEKFEKLGEEAQENEEKRQEKFTQLERDVEDLIRKKSISSYEKIFADQTEEHRKGARNWLIITSLLTVGFSVIFWWFIKDLAPAGSQLTVILQNLVAKGFFLSLIYLLLSRSIKNYTAEKHLQTVNRHRQNALATFEEFEKAAGKNQETRDAVLLACTDAIFDANQSGYLSTKTSRSESAAPIQMVKGFVPTKPPTDSD